MGLYVMSSFGHYACKARNPQLGIWIRWSALHSCILKYCELLHLPFPEVRGRVADLLQVGPDRPPTEQQLWEATATLEAERNRFLERRHVFDRRRVKEKAQGKTSPTAKDFEMLYRPLD